MIPSQSAQKAQEVMPYWLWPWCAFLFLLPFEMLLGGLNLSLPFNALGLGAALLLAIAAPRANRLSGRPFHGRALGLAALVLLMHLSYFQSIDPQATRDALVLTGIAWVISLLATASFLTPFQVSRALRTWFWGGGAAALATIACVAQGLEGPDGRGSVVVRGVAMDPNFLTANFLFPAAIGIWFLRRRETRLEGLAGLGLMGWAAALAGSRGGVIALLAVVVGALAWERRFKAIGMLLVTVTALYMTFAPLLGRLGLGEDATGNGRTEVWQIALDEGWRRGLTGLGFSTFEQVSASASGFYWGLATHNTYLQAFSELGLLGLAALIAVMITHFRFRRRTAMAGAAFAGLFGLAVASMFLHFLAFKVLWGAWIVATQVAMAESASPVPARQPEPPPLPRLVPRSLTP